MEFKNKVQRVLGHVTQHLGQDATYYPCKGESLTVRVVFDNDYEIVDPNTEAVISSNAPIILVRLSDFPAEISENEIFQMSLEIGGPNLKYKVWSVQEDGQGGARVTLHRLA